MNGIRGQSCLRPDATLVIVDLDGTRERQVDFVACVHCQRIWPLATTLAVQLLAQASYHRGVVPEREFGFCQRCNGITCPGAKCQKCVPIEQWCDNVERGRPADYQPTRVAFPIVPLLDNAIARPRPAGGGLPLHEGA